ncbi:MAG: PDDEXK nuclease domain-containing protein [Flavobacteriaceae bacterium]|jgi:predicted nuclease of restriction endonuclease-like (RecB) superfamily|nr:PDDEXK nuclease domain-containing protein [Flavobacteriaceae bacterium]
MEQNFITIIQIIKDAQNNSVKAVNIELINLYWNIGYYISHKLSTADWGDKTVNDLADYIQEHNPELKGFNKRSLYRMIQFYETYCDSLIVSSVGTQLEQTNIQQVTNTSQEIILSKFSLQNIRQTPLVQLSWTHHRTIFPRCKIVEEREFYINLCINEKYSVRDLERQINSSIYERTMLCSKSSSPSIHKLSTDINAVFKDSYIFDFLQLPDTHNENDLQKGLISQMKKLILELGKDFLFIEQEYKVQVGNSDFYIDLLFYHRALQCLVAFELKADKFKPEHTGQLEFYLEALDRDVKRDNENPSIGILLCKDKDIEVVEYSMSRSLSPTMVAEYKMQLPDKKTLQRKLHELFQNNE